MFWKYQRPKTRASFRVLELGLGVGVDSMGESGEVEAEAEAEGEIGKWDLGLEGSFHLVKGIGRFVGLDWNLNSLGDDDDDDDEDAALSLRVEIGGRREGFLKGLRVMEDEGSRFNASILLWKL